MPSSASATDPRDGNDRQTNTFGLTEDVGDRAARAKATAGKTGSLSLAAPEFGPRKLYANLGRAGGQDDDDLFTANWKSA